MSEFTYVRPRKNLPDSDMTDSVTLRYLLEEENFSFNQPQVRMGTQVAFAFSQTLLDKIAQAGTELWNIYVEDNINGRVLLYNHTTITSFNYTIPNYANYCLDKSYTGITFTIEGYKWYPRYGQEDTLERNYTSDGWTSILAYIPYTYYPTMTLSNITPLENGFNGKIVAGITSIQCPVTLGHNDSADTIGFETPRGYVYYLHNSSLTIPYDYENNKFYTYSAIGASEDNYTITLTAGVYDLRGNGINNQGGEIGGSVSTTVQVYGYHLPTYDKRKTYVTRCNAAGKVDGAGDHALIHIELDYAVIDGTNSIQSITATFGGQTINATRGSIAEGYLEYIVAIAVESSADIDFEITDRIRTNEVSLNIPSITVPLSLYDAGSGTGVAFGQMAINPGVWCYSDLIFYNPEGNAKVPYVIRYDTDIQSIIARPLIGVKPKDITVRVKIYMNGSSADPRTPAYVQVYKNTAATTGGEPTNILVSDGNSVDFSLAQGDTLQFLLPTEWDPYEVSSAYLGTTKLNVSLLSHGQMTEKVTFTDENEVRIVCSDFSYTPAEYRPQVTMSVRNASSSYSIWDTYEIYSATNESKSFRTRAGAVYSFRATSAAKAKPTYWLVNGTRYNVEDLDNITINSNTTIIADFS